MSESVVLRPRRKHPRKREGGGITLSALRYRKEPKYRAKILAKANAYYKSHKAERDVYGREWLQRISRMTVKNQDIYFDSEPRIGLCFLCLRERKPGEKRFSLHHLLYPAPNHAQTLSVVVEVCGGPNSGCHGRLNRELKQIRKAREKK